MLKGWRLGSLRRFCILPQSESHAGSEVCGFHVLCLPTGLAKVAGRVLRAPSPVGDISKNHVWDLRPAEREHPCRELEPQEWLSPLSTTLANVAGGKSPSVPEKDVDSRLSGRGGGRKAGRNQE